MDKIEKQFLDFQAEDMEKHSEKSIEMDDAYIFFNSIDNWL